MKRWRPTPRQLMVAVLTGAAGSGLAFTIDGDRWVDGSTTIYVGVPGRSASGVAWSTALQEAIAEWNEKTSFKFVVNKNYQSPCTGYTGAASGSGFPNGEGDGKNGVDFRSNVCGNRFGDSVLAMTLSSYNSTTLGFDHIVETDIVFNDAIQWDVYDGPRKGSIDFRRVALHELGHALGLKHETSKTAIMAPSISDLDRLQTDDINGANALYSGPVNCAVTDLALHALVRDSLGQGDCRILDLYKGGNDTSYVDTYRIKLNKTTRLQLTMRSSQLDSVLILTDTKLKSLDIFDDSTGSCDVKADTTLAAGEYLLLANTYVDPRKCQGNEGAYTLTIADTTQPPLGEVQSLTGGAPAATLITGGATSDGGLTYRSSFAATETFDVVARLGIDPKHVGQQGRLFVLARLGNGTQYAADGPGRFSPFSGTLAQLPAFRSGPLQALEVLEVARALQGRTAGLAGQQIDIFVGYALASQPGVIHYGNQPLRFSISR